MNAKALTESVFSNAELADIIDFRFDVLENAQLEKFHDAQCDGLTNATKFCNYVADGSSLCAEAHSKAWWGFVACMYSVADPNGDKDHDAKNPLAHSTTFDKQVTTCASKLTDYSVTDLLACTHGSEGEALRKASAAKTTKPGPPIWVEVAGKTVASPHGPDLPRTQWVKDVITAVCDAYTGTKPQACSQGSVIV